ncbi:hypothetical protein OIDMADRAFT_32133 [Oidiodendron maius Zn]|uniref:AAA+ ATPase domain-containing protein n=1 Tax=Oidiodendron maius (strain Zn) TaxID=913774 RepID=A0A0C3GLZ3_OIDMZ|nr:hypothetical protein OIDMADRAFT_32133 [Oidiodendron maius Zn]
MNTSLGVHDLRSGSPTDPGSIAIDLVAVHGLGGHAFNTWTHPDSGTFWIRDLLQDRLPPIRPIVFGYNAKRVKHNAELDFADVATQLLAGLCRLRLLPEAVTLHTEQARSIAKCVHSFLFFATPHCGSSFADLAVVFQRITKVILDPPNNFLRDLCTISPELQNLHGVFNGWLTKEEIQCISFYEGFKRKSLFKNSIIVTRESAILNVPQEETICLNADHSSIVRFKNAEDDNFKIVLGKLKQLVDKSKQTPRPHVRRRSTHLHVPYMPGRYFVGRKTEITKLRDWLLDTEQRECKVIALYGLSGVGKTQLALKFAVDHMSHYDYIFFVNGTSLEVLRNDFSKIQKSLMISEDSRSAIDRMIDWLRSQDSHWLLIFDNANHLPLIVPYISQLIHAGQIILTTQDARVEKSDFVHSSLKIAAFTPEESQELLFSRAGLSSPMPKDIKAAETLLAEIGHLPLAVDSAGAFINVRRKSVTEYANLFHRFQRDVLDHRPHASSYDRSVVGTLELNFKEIDSRPNAYTLLCLLVFLDRAEVTEEFLKRGTGLKPTWGPSGESVLTHPADRYVPEGLITLLNNDFIFDESVEELISLSIITCTSRGETGRAFMLHPLYHKCAKFRMTRDQRRTYSADALFFLAHAFPTDEYVFEKGTGALGRSYIPHIYYAYESFNYPLNDLSIKCFESLMPKSPAGLTPCEQVANLILDANITYGQGDTAKNAYLLAWMDDLLESSSNLYLKARALEVRLAIDFYDVGDYLGGVKAAKTFLTGAKEAIKAKPELLDELTNAQFGVIEGTIAELLVIEVSVAENFEESRALLQGWSALNPAAPSSKEAITLGIRSRIRGKLSKDHGDWVVGEGQLKEFLDIFAVRGSQTEGWAAGDLAHVLMEMKHEKEAEKVLVKYLQPRRESQTHKERMRDRRSDTIYLEMLLGECLLLQNRYKEAEDTLQDVLQHLQNFESLWHFEKFRILFTLSALARLRHQADQFSSALEYWGKVLDYCLKELDTYKQKGKWGRDTLIPRIVLLSMADCYFELGNQEHALVLQQEALESIHSCAEQRWILGLGTYWLDWIKMKINQRIPYSKS